MSQILVSIIIPIYNVEKFIFQCLKSCVEQSYRNIEIICVDDCSVDSSKSIIQSFKNQDSRIVLIENSENKGVFYTKDIGARNAKGDYIFFLDGDDYIPENAIEILLHSINENAKIVAGSFKIVDEQYISVEKSIEWSEFGKMDAHRFLSQVISLNHWSQCAMLIDRHVYERITCKPFDVKIREDAIVLLQLCNYSDKVVVLNECVYNYVQRKTSALNHSKSTDQRASEDYKFAINFVALTKQMDKISAANRTNIELNLVKELSWTLNSKVNRIKNGEIVQKTIRNLISNSQLLKKVYQLHGIKMMLVYVATFVYPSFWNIASKINNKRK